MEIENLLVHQLKNMFMLTQEEHALLLDSGVLEQAREKTLFGLTHIKGKYFSGELNPYNSVMYCNYLYWLSRFLSQRGARRLADKVYYLNKALNAVELYHEVELPEIWSCEHPLGSVMGRAKYGDYFFFYQGCTVGGNWSHGVLSYPTIGDHVMMYSNSKILGNSVIGNNTVISANCYIINQTIPDNSLVFGQSPNLVIKKR